MRELGDRLFYRTWWVTGITVNLAKMIWRPHDPQWFKTRLPRTTRIDVNPLNEEAQHDHEWTF